MTTGMGSDFVLEGSHLANHSVKGMGSDLYIIIV